MAAVVARPKVRGVRGRDRAKQDFTWEDVERVHEFEDGWYVGWLKDPRDTATLGRLMGHCAGVHFVWTCEEKIWYFFALFDPEGVPHSTIHAKQATWMNKLHPRDSFPEIPPECRTWDVSYPSLEQVKECFKKVGKEYKPGIWTSPVYNSCTYDTRVLAGVGRDTFRHAYGYFILRDKPADVDPEIWDAYTKAIKAVEDNYNKNRGVIKIAGRRFKFDGKWLIVLSADNKSQTAANGSLGKKIAEWLNATARKEKK